MAYTMLLLFVVDANSCIGADAAAAAADAAAPPSALV